MRLTSSGVGVASAVLLIFVALEPVFAWQAAPAGLSQQPVVNLLGLLTNRNQPRRRAAYNELRRRADPAAVAGLVELLRFSRYQSYWEISSLLRELTGEDHGRNWVAWHEWLTAQKSVELPPRFLEWKAALFSAAIDPAYGRILYRGVPIRIPAEEIDWGGVKLDGIPALTNPKLLQADEADYLKPDDRVFGVEINGDARAYPLRIMDWHEMVNDVVGGQPVSLSYCTLCRTGILFQTTVEDRAFTFGSSGLVFRSNKLMYDHQTESLWKQVTGEPVVGRLANSGIQLKMLPSVVTTWQEWKRRHPQTLVLSTETGYDRDYSLPSGNYANYYASPGTMFPVRQRDDRVPPKTEVFALVVNGEPKAYVLENLRRETILNDTLGGENLVLVTHPETGAVRAYLRGVRRFQSFGASPDVLQAQDGSAWSVTEEALTGQQSGERLPRVAGHLSYWFAWYLFYPRTHLYGAGE